MSSSNTVSAPRLGDYLQVFRRQWLVLLIGLLLGLGLSLTYLHVAPKEYRSTTGVLVTPIADTSTGSARNSGINLDTEAQLVTSTDTVAAAAKTLGVPESDAGSLAGHVGVSVPPNTSILNIAYTSTTAAGAQRGSRAFANAYLDQRKKSATDAISAEDKALQSRIDAVNAALQQLLTATAPLPANSPDRARNETQITSLNNQQSALASQQNTLRASIVNAGHVVSQPSLPSSPSSPKTIVSLAAGIVLGLLAGAAVAYLRNRADDLVRSPEDLFRRTGVPVATVLSGRLHNDTVDILPPLSSDGRGYARLRNLVTTSLLQTDRRVLVVAGVRYGGGSVAANLAASLARSGEDVYLVCADVFGSTADALLGDREPRPGLGEVLAGEVDLDSALHTVPGLPDMRVLGPGKDPDRADALLQTGSPRKLIDRLLDMQSYVVIEAPATSSSPDAQTLANVAEMAVVVVEVGQTGAREVLDACAQFESMGTPVLGAVVARYGKDGESHAVAAGPDEAAPGAPDDVDDGGSNRNAPEDRGSDAGGGNRDGGPDRDAHARPETVVPVDPATVPVPIGHAAIEQRERPSGEGNELLPPTARDAADR